MLYESYCLVLALFHLISPEKHFKYPSFSTNTCWLEARRRTRSHLNQQRRCIWGQIQVMYLLQSLLFSHFTGSPSPEQGPEDRGTRHWEGGTDGRVGGRTGIQRTDRQRRTGTGASYSKHDGDHNPLSSICHCCSSTFVLIKKAADFLLAD